MFRNNFPNLLIRCLLFAFTALSTGCKSAPAPPTKPAVLEVKKSEVSVRSTLPPPAFKVFHQDGPKFVLTTAESATDDQISALIWQLHDAAQSRSFDKLKISQKQVDKGDPAATFNIYRGTKCAAERYADGPPPCGASYHAAGSYTVGTYGNPKWDSGSLVDADGKMTQLWASN